jgi:phosphoglycolate phosphatase-like HAD superfamily hydrolase
MAAVLPTPTAVLYDWDGFKVNSLLRVHEVHLDCLREFGMPDITFAQTIEMTAHGPNGAKAVLGMPDHESLLFVQRFEEIYFRFSPDFQLMPGAAEFFASHPPALPIGVVSNKDGKMLREEIAHLGWADRISAIVGVNEAPKNKPAPDAALFALQQMGIEPSKSVWFGGDTAGDMACAQGAGLTSILVTEHDYNGPVPHFRFNTLHQLKDAALPVFAECR